MPPPRRAGRSRLTLALLILTSITLVTLDFRGFGPLDAARSAALSVFAPVGDATHEVFRPVGDAWHGAFSYGDLERENESLRSQVNDLEGQIASGDVAKGSLKTLLEQANLPYVGDLKTTRARVMSGAIANFDDTIQIDKGSGAGIKKGMPVVAGTGLVGTVVQVSEGRSVVKLVTDSSFQVGINGVGSPVTGVARGQGVDRRMKATIDLTAQVQPGQILVTRGVAGGLFPPDLPLGTVASATVDDAANQQVLDIDLLANLHALTYVSVVLWEPAS